MFKKLILLLAVVIISLFSIPPQALSVHAALTAPASWDYAYKYNATTDQFEFVNFAGDKVDVPVYTRTADSTYYNYTYTGSGSGVLPFEVTLTFNRSNTSWKAYGGGYTSDDTKIGSDSTVGSVVKKNLIFNNLSTHDYLLYLDFSSSNASIFLTYYFNDILMYTDDSLPYNTLIKFYISNGMKIRITRTTSSAFFLDAFYLKDLGVSASYTEGYNDGYDQAETDIGWTDTNSDGYDDTSYDAGFVEGYTAGYADGYDDGYAQALADIGWTDENDDGWDDESYQAGLMDQSAFALGYNKGYTDGYMEGSDMETGAALNSGVMMIIGLLVAFGLMIIGFWTKARLFNLLAVAGSVFFITQFNSVPMIIMGFGLIIINLAYTFWGWKGGE